MGKHRCCNADIPYVGREIFIKKPKHYQHITVNREKMNNLCFFILTSIGQM